MSYLIYKHINKLNGKVYIGQTKFTKPELRWKNGAGYKTSPYFYNAIQKYGWDNFEHKIIEENIPTKHLANKKELFWISYFNSNNPLFGYNISLGADNHLYSANIIYMLNYDKQIIKIFNSLTEAEDYTGLSAKNLTRAVNGKIKSLGGYYWCKKEAYDNFIPSKAAKLKSVRAVLMLDETKNILKEFKSVSEACSFLRQNYSIDAAPSKICLVCKNKRCTAYNFYWCYKEDYNNYCIKKPYSNPYNATEVVQLTTDYKFVQIFRSQTEAAHHLGKANSGNMPRSLKDPEHKKAVFGFIWMYKVDWLNFLKNKDVYYEERKNKN